MNRALVSCSALLFAAGLAVGCAPSLETGCQGDDACAAGERCVAGACRPTTPGTDPDASRPPADAGGDATGRRDAAPATDAGPGDGGASDARATPPDAEATCPPPPGAPVPSETCNGLDDDCDGKIDEDEDGAPLARSCFDGDAMQRNVGRCRDGLQRCEGGRFGACMGQIGPAGETCNATDDDCNGTVDDGPGGAALEQSCYSGPAGTEAIAPCRVGASTCRNGVLGPCVGEVVPGREICDGTDNDCSGAVDDVPGSEDCGACEPGAVRPCYTGPEGTAGTGECVAGRQACGAEGDGWGPCEGVIAPSAEECNGRDDDCDGLADNEVAGVGEDCHVGLGTCEGDGHIVCRGEAGLLCDALTLEPVEERCNGRDDDCDGETDEDFGLGTPCTTGVGVCLQIGEYVCDGDGGATCNARPGRPGVEDCNGVDDDCDGEVDEGLDNALCYEGAAGTQENRPCHEGRRRCDSSRWTACVDQTLPQNEICDGVDNDCNGEADDIANGNCECAPNEMRACYSGPANTVGRGLCQSGTQTCQAGAWGACVGEVVPTAEICDGRDNDCNNRNDDVPGLGDVCAVGAGGCRRDGTLECGNGGLQCNALAGAPAPETCNGVDDDCDGSVDDVAGVGDACEAGVGVCAAVGRRVCRGDELICDAVLGSPGPEVCNGLDDNCNGSADEGAASLCEPAPNAAPACTNGTCQYTCAPRYYNINGMAADGCERGCDGPVAGVSVALVSPFPAQRVPSYEFSVAPDGLGGAAVAYVQNDLPGASAPMRLQVLGQDVVAGAATPGVTFNGASVTFGAGRWAVFGNQFIPLLAAQSLVAGVVGTTQEGDLGVTRLEWPRATGVIPGATTFGLPDRAMAVAYTIASQNGDRGLGRLQTRVLDLMNAGRLDDGLIGLEEDYVTLPEARLIAVPYDNGTAVLAQIASANGTQLRFLTVAPNGDVRGSAVAQETIAGPTRDLGVAVNGRQGIVVASDGPNLPIRLWSLTMNQNHRPEFTFRANPPISGEGVDVAWGRHGPVVFARTATGWNAWLLDAAANVVAGPLTVIQRANPDDIPQRLRVATTGNRIAVAFSTTTDRGNDGVPEQEIRLGFLDCR
ncbi:hypothetical protein L6V77_12440 [Myxococcota bacterium]|nr:hypothetical protein [Myxococcota bacterium]